MAFPQWMRRAARRRRAEKMQSKFTVPSTDTGEFGVPPAVDFTISADRHEIHASPPGAEIGIYHHDARSDGTFQSRVCIHDTEADLLVADFVLSHVKDTRWPHLENEAYYAAETACAIYWSMWRGTKARARDANGSEVEDG